MSIISDYGQWILICIIAMPIARGHFFNPNK